MLIFLSRPRSDRLDEDRTRSLLVLMTAPQQPPWLHPPLSDSAYLSIVRGCLDYSRSKLVHQNRFNPCVELAVHGKYLQHVGNITKRVLPSFMHHLGSLPPIPRLIHLSWRDGPAILNSNASLAQLGVKRLMSLNPHWNVHVWNDTEIESYIAISPHLTTDDRERLQMAHIVEKSDLFRLLVLYDLGGYYQDIDRPFNIPLDRIINRSGGTRMLLPVRRREIVQDVMCTAPGNQIFKRAFELNLQRRRQVPRTGRGKLEAHDMYLLGPISFYHAVTESLFGEMLLPDRQAFLQIPFVRPAEAAKVVLSHVLRAARSAAPLIVAIAETSDCETMVYSLPPLACRKDNDDWMARAKFLNSTHVKHWRSASEDRPDPEDVLLNVARRLPWPRRLDKDPSKNDPSCLNHELNRTVLTGCGGGGGSAGGEGAAVVCDAVACENKCAADPRCKSFAIDPAAPKNGWRCITFAACERRQLGSSTSKAHGHHENETMPVPAAALMPISRHARLFSLAHLGDRTLSSALPSCPPAPTACRGSSKLRGGAGGEEPLKLESKDIGRRLLGSTAEPSVHWAVALAMAAARSDWPAFRRTLEQRTSKGSMDATAAMRAYFYSYWHPGKPHGIGCTDLEHLGSDGGNAGKAVCAPQKLLDAASPCQVISVGSDGDAAFEMDVHARAPHCNIDTFDGTLTGPYRAALRKRLPEYVRFHAENWGLHSWRRFANLTGGVALLKIDCESCELDALPAFLANVDTRQVVVETHGCQLSKRASSGAAHTHTLDAVDKYHAFMTRLWDLGFRIFAREDNILWSDGTCIEFSLMRPQM